MLFGIGLNTRGVKAIARAFRDLEPALARKVIRRAMREGAKVVQASMKDLAPVDTGAGKKRIRVKASKGPRGSRRGKVIALAVLAGDAKGPTWYMHLQEFGWKTGSRKQKSGRRKIPGKHFARRAMRSEYRHVQYQLANDILEGIEKITASGNSA